MASIIDQSGIVATDIALAGLASRLDLEEYDEQMRMWNGGGFRVSSGGLC
jgi:hypothetical protein